MYFNVSIENIYNTEKVDMVLLRKSKNSFIYELKQWLVRRDTDRHKGQVSEIFLKYRTWQNKATGDLKWYWK